MCSVRLIWEEIKWESYLPVNLCCGIIIAYLESEMCEYFSKKSDSGDFHSYEFKDYSH